MNKSGKYILVHFKTVYKTS